MNTVVAPCGTRAAVMCDGDSWCFGLEDGSVVRYGGSSSADDTAVVLAATWHTGTAAVVALCCSVSGDAPYAVSSSGSVFRGGGPGVGLVAARFTSLGAEAEVKWAGISSDNLVSLDSHGRLHRLDLASGYSAPVLNDDADATRCVASSLGTTVLYRVTQGGSVEMFDWRTRRTAIVASPPSGATVADEISTITIGGPTNHDVLVAGPHLGVLRYDTRAWRRCAASTIVAAAQLERCVSTSAELHVVVGASDDVVLAAGAHGFIAAPLEQPDAAEGATPWTHAPGAVPWEFDEGARESSLRLVTLVSGRAGCPATAVFTPRG